MFSRHPLARRRRPRHTMLSRLFCTLFCILLLVASGSVTSSAAGEENQKVFGFNGPLVSRWLTSVSWPSPWEYQKAGLGGDVRITVEADPQDPHQRVLRLRATRASFVLYQDLRSRPFAADRYPLLSWRWKALTLPRGGNANYDSTNDQVLQVYLAFRRSDGYDVIGYVWDNPAREGDKDVIHRTYNSLIFGRVELYTLVLRRGTADEWLTESRNVTEDHDRYFKNSRPLVVAIGIWCDSDHTSSVAEGLIGPLIFSESTAKP
ncbi:MAG: DUF3047 domain-containing protein [Thermogutta sp.]